ncbi:AAC_HP2_G0007100.mRNA.1.CDS.1 [Saccharomyces cerevisiae]|nr:AAC_HP2_G0007100.mRNA.1.CDS.1 [Saccharomyces cerevisiae]CAI6418366.1 AAC_HP2_G0007100.mRNA.1.CDS.1 [Saccharomyces cerevisiae]CAI6422460.1 AAC_HP1_G0008190.mRNA.1.CDS.1 [Saccharomyces cerevisiae]CAI6534956.1 AAC_collapsed_G0007420.mRNA.1.CDS.1 [Saccharomyces cerevisiae]CAI7060688.1 ATV_collapsed_G0007140.mRNA.1.CDS.1 [Saccharomyces cerevisiae]
MKRAIDIYNSEGQQLAHLPTATVPAVISWHPLRNWIAGGNSSGKIFLFTDDSGTIKQEE